MVAQFIMDMIEDITARDANEWRRVRQVVRETCRQSCSDTNCGRLPQCSIERHSSGEIIRVDIMKVVHCWCGWQGLDSKNCLACGREIAPRCDGCSE